MLYLREPSGLRLRELADELHTDDNVWGGTTNEVRIAQDTGDGLTLTFGRHQVPATRDALEQLGTFLNVPRNFLLTRLGEYPDLQQQMLQELLSRDPANIQMRFTDGGVHEVFRPSRVRLEPRAIVERIMRIVPEESDVIEWWSDSDDLRFDVAVPMDFDRGVGGDRQVDDISRGGLRVHQDRKNNHAPNVESYIYRLACTNGMVVPDPAGISVDARGATVDVILAELELAAERAFSQVEQQIEHFYEMRQQRIEGDVTQAVIQVAQERGLPDRTAMTLSRRVPDQLNPDTLGREPTMFDLVNLITNQANDPHLRNRRGPRAALERAGGTLVREQHDRCGTCHQTLN